MASSSESIDDGHSIDKWTQTDQSDNFPETKSPDLCERDTQTDDFNSEEEQGSTEEFFDTNSAHLVGDEANEVQDNTIGRCSELPSTSHQRNEETEKRNLEEDAFQVYYKARRKQLRKDHGPGMDSLGDLMGDIHARKLYAELQRKKAKKKPSIFDLNDDMIDQDNPPSNADDINKQIKKALLGKKFRKLPSLLKASIDSGQGDSLDFPVLHTLLCCFDFEDGFNNKNLEDELFLYLLNEGCRLESFVKDDFVDISDEYGYTLLTAAVEKNMVEVVTFLLENNANTAPCTFTGDSPLSIACNRDKSEMALMLLKHGANPISSNNFGDSPLHKCQTVTVVEALITAGAQIDCQNDDGQTPLHKSLVHNKEDVAKYLIDKGSDIHALDNEGRSAIELAIGQGLCRHLADYVVEAWSTGTLDQTDNWIVFRCAVLSCNIAAMKKLIALDVNVNHQGYDGRTPLLLFCCGQIDNADVIQLLIDNGADIDSRDEYGNCAIHWACFNGLYNTMVKLMGIKDLANIRNDSGTTPLMKAVKGNRVEIVEQLINNNAKLDSQDKIGYTALHYAVKGDQSQCVSLLTRHQCSLDIQNARGQSAFHLALIIRNKLIAKLLYDLIQENDEIINPFPTVLYKACVDNDPEYIAFLISCGGDVDEICYERSLLHSAYFEKSKEAVRCLLEAGAAINKADPEGWFLLLEACQDDTTEYVEMLIELGRDIDFTVKDASGRNAVHYACKNRNENLIALLLKEDRNCEWVRPDETGTSLLHLVAKTGDTLLFHTLLSGPWPININITDSDGQTPLLVAGYNGHQDIIELIINLETSNVNRQRFDGLTALHVAKTPEIVKRLIAKGANPLTEDNKGNIPFLFHCQMGRLQCAKELSTICDNINGMKRTALHVLADNNDTGEIADVELCSDINAVDINGQTALHLACSRGHLSTVRGLLSLGTDVNITDKCNLTALHIAKDDSVRLEFEKNSGIEKTENDEQIINSIQRFQTYMMPKRLAVGDCFLFDFKRYYELINSPLVGFIETDPQQQTEYDDMTHNILLFMKAVAERVKNVDQDMAFNVIQSGSVSESTKIGQPNQFDFLCVLKNVSALVQEPSFFTFDPSFVELFSKQPMNKDFFDDDGQLLTFKLLHRFHKAFTLALRDESLWLEFPKFYFASDTITRIKESSSTLQLTWRGDVYVWLPVSVDIVPAIYFKSWAPYWCDNPFGLATKHGSYAVPSSKGNVPAKLQSKLFQLWFPVAEAELISMMPNDLVEGLKIAKFAKDIFSNVCMVFVGIAKFHSDADTSPCGQDINVNSAEQIHKSTMNYLSSYLLKTCACQLFLEDGLNGSQDRKCSKLQKMYYTLKQANRIFKKLLDSFHLNFLPSPFVRGYNLLKTVSEDETAYSLLQSYTWFLCHIVIPNKFDILKMSQDVANVPFLKNRMQSGFAPQTFSPDLILSFNKLWSNPESWEAMQTMANSENIDVQNLINHGLLDALKS